MSLRRYVDGVLLEVWDDAAQVYRQLSTTPETLRPYTTEEQIEAAARAAVVEAAERTCVPQGWYDDFANDVDWRDNWTTAFRAAGDFVVTGGTARLRATGQNTGAGADVYLKSRDIPFRSGFTVVAQSRRSLNDGQMVEFEMGADGHGPVWHFEWSNNALIFWRQVRIGGVPKIVQETPASIGAGDTLRFAVTCTRRTIDFTVLNVTTGRIAMSGVYPLDFTVSAAFDEGSHLNFVTTSSVATSPTTPVAQDIDFVKVVYLPTGEGGDGVFRNLYARGGNVVTRADGRTTTVLSGIVPDVAGGGIAAGATFPVVVTLPVALAGAPTVTLTPVGHAEGGSEGECKAWLKGAPTGTSFVARVKNEATLPQTISLHWRAEYSERDPLA